jgi:methylthioribose-1-phosphate isomerase
MRSDEKGHQWPIEVVGLGPESVRVLDQRLVPKKLTYLDCKTPKSVAAAISKMAVRGAPAIGLCGAFGMAVAARRAGHRRPARMLDDLRSAGAVISRARPTARDLEAAVLRVMARAEESDSAQVVDAVVDEAMRIREELDRACCAIAEQGAELLAPASAVLTYCNTGILATAVSTGTALGAIEYRWRAGGGLMVWVPETRPYFQGSRLTAFELTRLKIPFSIITDAACGAVISSGKVDAVIVGADRIASNGDVANKVGTYPLAVLAHRHGIPFYVAAPTSTFDLSLGSGRDIPIEVRDGREILTARWFGAETKSPDAFYPAFDVTPGELITAIVCEAGVIRPPYGKSIEATLADRVG